MKYTVTTVKEMPPFNNKISYSVNAQDEQGQIHYFFYPTAIAVGSILDGQVETKTSKTGKTFYEFVAAPVLPPVPAHSAPQSTATPQASPNYPPREDPQLRQGSIERQHSVTSAIAYLAAKTSHMDDEAALKEFTGEHVVRIAAYFHKYTSGRLVLPEPKNSVEDVMSEPLPEYAPGEEEI